MMNDKNQDLGQSNETALASLIASRSPNESGKGASFGSSGDEDALSSLIQSRMSSAPASAPASSASRAGRTQPSTPTRFQTAGRPAAAEEPELSWGDTGRQAIKNFLPSAGEALKATGHAIVNPSETLGALGQLGKGAMSQLSGAVGFEQDPAKKAESERLINALEEHYKQSYGSMKGFKKALATDPASMLMDFSTLAGGAGFAGKAAGLSKAAKVANAASAFTDPVQLALKTAALPIKGVAKVVPYAQAFTSGASVDALRDAARAGADPKMAGVFKSHLTDASKHPDLVDALEQALKKKSDERSSAYIADQKANFSGNLPDLNYNPLDASFKSSMSSIINKKTGVPIYKDAAQALQEMQTAINDSRFAGASTIEHFDDLKKEIGEIRKKYSKDPQAVRVTTDMYNAVMKSIVEKHPEYANMMKRYGDASDELFQIKSAFGIGKRISDESILRKVLGSKNSANKKNLLAELAESNPEIPYMLAGQELHSWMPGGARQIGHLITAGMYGANPLGLAAQGIAASPRIAANVNYAAGKVGNLAGKATQPAVTKGAYYAGRANEEMAQPSDEAPAADDTFEKMLNIESGNKQFDANNNPITSKKGAIGIAQVMPDTAPEAAQMAGLPWDEEKYRTDEQYNKAIGKAYYENMRSIFNDPLIAAAAYNAGPGAVKKAIEKAETMGGDYLDYLPPETRNYVARLAPSASASGGRIERASGGKVDGAKHERIVNKLMAMANKAKKVTDKTTESLLDEPDESIVKALNVAQQAI